ncbi:hypothetical protein SESBI_20213 [Sesbania bispinosa]|nr:hypothetical protein SESBI_20213 [Sesbania bispinosa]
MVSTIHLTMKFPLPSGNLWAVKAYQVAARRCYKDSLRIKRGEWVASAENPPHEFSSLS